MPGSEAQQTGDRNKPAILIVDDDEYVTRSLARSLRDQFTVFTANASTEALDILAHKDIAVVLTDQRMPGISGVELLEQARNLRPETVGIVISGYTDIVALIDAINLGTVRGYIPKPWDLAELRQRLENAVHSYQASFLNRDVLRSSAAAIASMQDEVARLQQALDLVASGESAETFLKEDPAQPKVDQLAYDQHKQTTAAGRDEIGHLLLREAVPDVFEQLTEQYGELIDMAMEQRVYKVDHRLSHRLRSLSKRLGHLQAGPRDLVEIHSTALKKKLQGTTSPRKEIMVEEGRLMLLELMGHVITYYRVNCVTRPDLDGS